MIFDVDTRSYQEKGYCDRVDSARGRRFYIPVLQSAESLLQCSEGHETPKLN